MSLQLLAGATILTSGNEFSDAEESVQRSGRPVGFPVGSIDGYGFMFFDELAPVLPVHKDVVAQMTNGEFNMAEEMLDAHLKRATNDLYGYRLAIEIADRQGKLPELGKKWKSFDERLSRVKPTTPQKLALLYLSEVVRARILLKTLPKTAEPEAGFDGGLFLQELSSYTPSGRLDAMMFATVYQRHLERNLMVARLGAYLKKDENFYQLRTYYAYLHQGTYYVTDSGGNRVQRDMDIREMKRQSEAVISVQRSYAPAYYVAAIASSGDQKKQWLLKCKSLSKQGSIWFYKSQWHLDNISR